MSSGHHENINRSDASGSGYNRRRFLWLLGAAGAGMLCRPSAQAFSWGVGSSQEGQLSNFSLDDSLIRSLGSAAKDYGLFLQRLNLKHITLEQIIASHAKRRGSVSNQIPPKLLWNNIRNTLRLADRLAEMIGEPVKEVISVYRSPACNAQCPGASRVSMHLRNIAIDLHFRMPSQRVAKAARELRAKGAFKGGVGQYPLFTHIDTRGRNADW